MSGLATKMTRLLCQADARQIAVRLGDGRSPLKSGKGWKTFCPICRSACNSRKQRRTLSVAVSNGKLLVYCHRNKCDRVGILRELVRRGLLPDTFRESSRVRAIVQDVRAAAGAVAWKGIAGASDLAVLMVLCEIAHRSCKAEFNASTREVAEGVGLAEVTAWRSLGRLVKVGWVERLAPATGTKAATWRLRNPRPNGGIEPQQSNHADKAGDRLIQVDPRFTEGARAGLPRSAPIFHDLFGWGRGGLGLVKGRIYSLLAIPMNANEIAHSLGYKQTRNVRLHIRVLIQEGLVHRLEGRYQHAGVDLDTVAARRRVLGTGERRRSRHQAQRIMWTCLLRAFEHFQQTGEVIDPQTGEILRQQAIPPKRTRMRTFRLCLLLLRASRIEQANSSSEAAC
jgi:predicted transcriptional regulator